MLGCLPRRLSYFILAPHFTALFDSSGPREKDLSPSESVGYVDAKLFHPRVPQDLKESAHSNLEQEWERGRKEAGGFMREGDEIEEERGKEWGVNEEGIPIWNLSFFFFLLSCEIRAN